MVIVVVLDASKAAQSRLKCVVKILRTCGAFHWICLDLLFNKTKYSSLFPAQPFFKDIWPHRPPSSSAANTRRSWWWADQVLDMFLRHSFEWKASANRLTLTAFMGWRCWWFLLLSISGMEGWNEKKVTCEGSFEVQKESLLFQTYFWFYHLLLAFGEWSIH